MSLASAIRLTANRFQ